MKLKSVDRTILVESSTVDLGDVLPSYARDCILQLAGKYFGRLNTASVHFNREGITYRCTVNIQMGALRMMSGEAKNKDIYAAFRTALEKVAKQLRRAKRELREDKAERIDKDIVLRETVGPGSRARRLGGNTPPTADPAGYQVPLTVNQKSAFRFAAE